MTIFDLYMDTIVDMAEHDERIVLLDCDLAKCFKSIKFEEKFPDRYFNFGICEQNTISIAAGMAKQGLLPIVQGFSPFFSTRALDQLKNSICYPDLKVTVVGQKAGLSDSLAGATHQSIDDIGIVSSIPNITIYNPSNSSELLYAVRDSLHVNIGPTYIRIENNICINENLNIDNQDISTIINGYELAIVATGNIVNNCIQVVNDLNSNGHSIKLISLNKLKPITPKLLDEIGNIKKLVFVDASNVITGMGTIVLRYLNEKKSIYNVKVIGIEDIFTESGQYSLLLKKYKLDNYNLKERILQFLCE